MFPDVSYASSVNESNESFAAQSASRLHLADSANRRKKKITCTRQQAQTPKPRWPMINESSGAVPGKGHVLVQLCLTHIDGLGDEKGGANFLLLVCLFPATR